MSENALRKKVLKALQAAGLDPVGVQGTACPGIPDINFVDGWLELKVAKVPGRREGRLCLSHFKPQQRAWLLRRWRAGGNAWLLLQVGREYLLFDGETAATLLASNAKLATAQLLSHHCTCNLKEALLHLSRDQAPV